MNTEYEKFGGWLLVYFVLTVVGIVFSIPSILIVLELGFTNLAAFANFSFLTLFVFSLLALGLQITRILILTKRETKTYHNLVLIQFGEIALALITIIFSFSSNLTYVISNLIVSLLWIMYLRSSNRVKTFYNLSS